MDDPTSGGTQPVLTWGNIGLGLAFIAFDAIFSAAFSLGVGYALVTAAVRCVAQLSIMALLLQKVFETDNPWAVAGLVGLLNVMGTFETVVNKSKRRYDYMFPTVLAGMLCSTIPISVIGTRFAMSVDPFWQPARYVPIVGMLCGSTISGIVVAISFVLRELHDNRDKIETYLAFGASRIEACRPVATEALRLALTPNINQMSVLGIIAIPGMMTGAILGGSSVAQAARLQMIIIFMISSSTALAAIVTTLLCMSVVVDNEHRIRSDRVDSRPHIIWRTKDWVVGKVAQALVHTFAQATHLWKRTVGQGEEERRADAEARQGLLG